MPPTIDLKYVGRTLIWSNLQNSIYTRYMTTIKRYFLYLKYYNELKRKDIFAICLPYQVRWANEHKYASITELQAFSRGFATVYRRIYAENKLNQLH